MASTITQGSTCSVQLIATPSSGTSSDYVHENIVRIKLVNVQTRFPSLFELAIDTNVLKDLGYSNKKDSPLKRYSDQTIAELNAAGHRTLKTKNECSFVFPLAGNEKVYMQLQLLYISPLDLPKFNLLKQFVVANVTDDKGLPKSDGVIANGGELNLAVKAIQGGKPALRLVQVRTGEDTTETYVQISTKNFSPEAPSNGNFKNQYAIYLDRNNNKSVDYEDAKRTIGQGGSYGNRVDVVIDLKCGGYLSQYSSYAVFPAVLAIRALSEDTLGAEGAGGGGGSFEQTSDAELGEMFGIEVGGLVEATAQQPVQQATAQQPVQQATANASGFDFTQMSGTPAPAQATVAPEPTIAFDDDIPF